MPQLVTHLDEGRRSYARNKDSMVYWRNDKEKLRIQLWFREAAVLRAHLDQFAPPPVGPASGTSRFGRIREMGQAEIGVGAPRR